VALSYQPVLECTRGPIVESTHDGIIAIATSDGTLLGSVGEVDAVVYMRSSAKPFQAVPIIRSGAADAFAIRAADLAIMCSSHSGTDEHVAVLEGIQQRLGISEDALQTGRHWPYHRETAIRLRSAGEEPTQNRHNCSGKHTGMLAIARHLGFPEETYTERTHPVQEMSLHEVATLCGIAEEDVVLGVDGCSVPTFAVPMVRAATGYARIMDPDWGDQEYRHALDRIRVAMTSHPHLVAGPGRFDTALMEATHGRILAKGGAEGYQAIGVPGGNRGSNNPPFGITVKIKDGDLGKRAVAAVAMTVLRRLHVLSDDEETILAPFAPRSLTNHAGLTIGHLRPCFRLVQGA